MWWVCHHHHSRQHHIAAAAATAAVVADVPSMKMTMLMHLCAVQLDCQQLVITRVSE